MKHAMSLLKETQYNIQEIARESGFRNSNCFAIEFMARFGVYPTDSGKNIPCFPRRQSRTSHESRAYFCRCR